MSTKIFKNCCWWISSKILSKEDLINVCFYHVSNFPQERDVTLQLVRRAEQHGYKALFLTVDTPFFGKRLADNRNKFKLPKHLKLVWYKCTWYTYLAFVANICNIAHPIFSKGRIPQQLISVSCNFSIYTIFNGMQSY